MKQRSLFTKQQLATMRKNHQKNATRPERPLDLKPVVKVFGGSSCTWLLTEYDEENDLFFGLCDLGFGFPEIGYVSRQELEEVRFKPFNLPAEVDRFWTSKMTLSEWAKEAKDCGGIYT